MNYIQRLVDYLKSARLEIRQVNWPTRKEAVQFTVLVIVISIGVSVYLGALDLIMTRIVQRLLF